MEIIEKINASQKSTTSVDKSRQSVEARSGTAAVNPNSFGRAGAAGSNSNTFSGKGATESSNDFSGTIAATVIEVLPNGHLVIAGEKQIGVNANVDVLRFSGQVDPRAIEAGNSVQSTRSPTCASNSAAAGSRPRRNDGLAGTVLFERSADLRLQESVMTP